MPEIPPNIIRRRLQELRMTYQELADNLGVTKQAVARWASGSSDPGTRHLPALAAALGVNIEILVVELAGDEQATS